MVELCVEKIKREEISLAKYFVLKHSYNTNTWNVSVKRSMFSEYPQVQRIICYYYSSFLLVQLVLRYFFFILSSPIVENARTVLHFASILFDSLFIPTSFSSSFHRRVCQRFSSFHSASTCLWMCTNITCKNNATSCSRIYYLNCECAHFLSFYIKIEQTQNERKKK